MSRLSVHYNDSGNKTGFGDFLKKCYDAGSPVGVIYSLNGNIAPTIAQNSPGTKWVYRRQSDGWERLPNNFYNDDPQKSATKWLTAPLESGKSLLDMWRLNPADWFDPLNEPVIELADPNDPAQVAEMIRRAEYINTWMLTALDIAHNNGFKLALFSFPFGSPAYAAWPHLLPSLRLAKQYGGILSLHSYTEAGPLLQRDANGAFTQLTLDTALRHRRIYASLPIDAQLPLLYSECSTSNGYGVEHKGKRWVELMGEYDTELIQDDYIIRLDGFQLGGSESNLVSALGDYGDYIAAHKTIVVTPPPIEPVIEHSTVVTIVPQASVSIEVGDVPNPRLILPAGSQGVVTQATIRAVVHLIPPNATEAEVGFIVAQAFPEKNTVLFSPDNARDLVLQGAADSQVIIWNPERWADDIVAFFKGCSVEVRQLPAGNT